MFMSRSRTLLVCCMCILFGICLVPVAAQPASQSSTAAYTVFLPLTLSTLPAEVQRVVDLTNQERAAAGCSALRVSNLLNEAAQGHSQNMALHDFFSHTGWDGSSPWDRMEAVGYTAGAAENIAAGYSTPDAVMAAWMGSSGHRANILNCSLTEIGIGYYYQSDDQANVRLDSGSLSGPFGYYWTQDFGAATSSQLRRADLLPEDLVLAPQR